MVARTSHLLAVPLTGALALALAAPAGQELPADTLPAELPRELPLGLTQDDHAPDDVALVALGRRLFFSGDLSLDGTVSCASCHRPELGFAHDSALSPGLGGALTERNSPTLFNRALGNSFLWDGRAETLEAQVLMPIDNADELGLGVESAIERLAADPEWRAAFESATGAAPSEASLASALAAFVRALTLGDSPVDRYRAGDHEHLNPAAISGMWLFESRGRCLRCHSGPNFSDERFHNTGVGAVDGVAEPGRFAITGEAADRGAFKTPTLRGTALTAPYMHDGSLATLEEVVEFYRGGGESNPDLSRHVAPIEMTDEDAANLVAFLRALSVDVEGELAVDGE